MSAALRCRTVDRDSPRTPGGRPAHVLRPRAVASSLVDAVGKSVRLNSDEQRHGQNAFVASPFSRLALTHVLSLGGDALVTLALAGSLFFNISLSAARGRVALSLVLTMAPFAVVAPFLGPIIDRAHGGRRVMVVVSALGRALACLLMAGYIHSLLLFPAAFLTLVCSKGYTVAKAALVPSAVEQPEDLVEANSKLAVGGAVAGFLFAIPGVAILKLFNAAWLLRVDVVLFLVCALTSLRIQASTPPDPTPVGSAPSFATAPPPGVGPDLPPGAIQVVAVAMATLRMVVGFMTFLVAFGFRHEKAPAWWYGVVLAGSIGGNLVGAAVAPWLRPRLKEEWILAGSVITVAIGGLVAIQFTSLHSRPAATLLATVIGVSAGAAKLAFDSLVQRHVPVAAQGRAFGRFEAAFQLVWVLGALVPVVIPMSLRAGFTVVTLSAFLAAVTYLVGTQLARVDRLPRWWPGVTKPSPSERSAALAVADSVGARGDHPGFPRLRELHDEFPPSPGAATSTGGAELPPKPGGPRPDGPPGPGGPPERGGPPGPGGSAQ